TPDGSFGTLEHGILPQPIEGHDPGYGGFTWLDQFGGRTEFDAQGLIQKRIDRNLNSVEYAYTDGDADGLDDDIESITTQGGLKTEYIYSGATLVVKDFANRQTQYELTGGFVTQITAPDPDYA